MNLRSKTILLLGIIFLGIMGMVYLSVEKRLSNGFDAIERQDMEAKTLRISTALYSKYSALEITATDWSNWDTAYRFAEDYNQEFIDDNLASSSFAPVRINLIMFYNASGSIIWANAYAGDENWTELPIPPNLQNIGPSDILLVHDSPVSAITGTLMTPLGPMMISSKPIVTSKGEGPSHGTLILGRFLDDEEIDELSQITGLPVTMYAVGDKNMPQDYKTAEEHIRESSQAYLHIAGNDTLHGFGLIKDVYGKPALVYRTESPRNAYLIGRATTNDLLIVFLMSSVVGGFIISYFFDSTLLSRLSEIISGVRLIGETGEFNGLVPAKGKDELTELSKEINTMLTRLNEDLKRQEAISNISGVYLGLENFTENTRNALEILGETIGASRVYIFEDYDEGKKARNTYEWVARGITPQKEKFQNLSYDTQPGFKKELERIAAASSTDTPSFPSDYQNIAVLKEAISSLVLPVVVNKKIHGFIGLDDCKKDKKRNYSDVVLLGTVARIVSEAFERKNAMESLEASIAEQKRLEKIKTEFLSVTSHELRTPITPMKAQLQMVLGQYFGTLTKEQKTSLEMVLRNATRLDHLICDILDISKLESGNMKFIVATADLNELVKNAVETLKYNANEKNITLDMKLGDIPLMALDRDRITQVIMNLITNAVKFTDPGGHITIKTKNDKDKATVEVTDSGIGIKEEDLRGLFTPFFQVDSSMNRNHEGTGLGLAICKGIVLNHGGEINVKSTPGKGSVFSVALPYNEVISSRVVKEVELFKLK